MNVIKYIFGADSTQYETTVDKMKRSTHELTRNIESQFKRVGGAIAGYLSFTAIKGAIDNAINYFDNLAHKAEQLGVSASFVQVFEHAMRSVGGASQQADKAIADFGKRVGEAMQGTGTLLPILEQFGIALYDADGSARSMAAVMGDYANAMANAATPQEKLFLSAQAFGEKAGPKMVEVLKDGAVGMNEMMSAFQKAHPEFETTAKRLSAASQALEDMRTKITIFVGETVGYWLDKLGTMSDAILEYKRLWGDVWFGIAGVFASTVKTLTGGLVDFTDKVLEMRVKFDSWLVEGHEKTMKANAEQKGAIDSATESVNRQVEAIDGITNATETATRAAKIRATVEAENSAKLQSALVNEAKANEQINLQKDRRLQSEYGIVDRLYKQGLELQDIVNKYPKLLEAAQIYSNLTGDTVTEVENLKKEIDAATDATNDLANAAANIHYPTGGGGAPGTTTGNVGQPDPNWRTNLQLQNTGSGGGYFGTFQGMDPANMSVDDIIRASRDLEEKLAKFKGTVSNDMLQINKIYVRQIEEIMKNLNNELSIRAQAEIGGRASIPRAGFSSPEQYFKKLDSFIEKLYEKEDKKSTVIDDNKKVTQAQIKATEKLGNAFDRFAGTLERSGSIKLGGGYR